jgi:hypothetical protein
MMYAAKKLLINYQEKQLLAFVKRLITDESLKVRVVPFT